MMFILETGLELSQIIVLKY